MNISVIGMGYVGIANAVMFARNHNVSVNDIDSKKVINLNNKRLPFFDELANNFLLNEDLSLKATTNFADSIKDSTFMIICTSTDYDEASKAFDTSSVESVINKANSIKYKGLIVIRSTVPVGFTNRMIELYPALKICFFPEFLREGQALQDSLNPSRIVSGSNIPESDSFIELLCNSFSNKNKEIIKVSPKEAEAIKLFSNAYLAMRVAFFNEVDNFALSKSLDTKNLIDGISLDKRIGNFYNNPSFGFGGYCLPKDTKQVNFEFGKTPQKIFNAIMESNKTRKDYIVKKILEIDSNNIGVYKISMKKGSDNYRESAILDIMSRLKENNKEIYIFEPNLKHQDFRGFKVIKNFNEFISNVDLILANRIDKNIIDSNVPIFSRDIYERN
tara:strand:- start:1955 stop:3121 length:1167 start_codon:yes stop_codon:yes gene_type:complete